MSRPYTEDDLYDQLVRDLTWRIKEISDLKSAVRNADEIAKVVLLRATVAICYAHWEGHIRLSAQKFMQHVSLKGLKFEQLETQYLRNYFLPRIVAINLRTSYIERGKLVDEILISQTKSFSRVNNDLINTRSNLSHEVLCEICAVCGVETDVFDGDKNFIDVVLLKRRNSIAHGEDTMIGETELDDITSRTIAMMRKFSNSVQNLAFQKSYRRERPLA